MKILDKITVFFKFFNNLQIISQKIDNLRLAIGLNNSLLNDTDRNKSSINDYEFKVFSQFGDDGILQYLIKNIDIKNKTFVEFGVENYEEANTRFLLENNNWDGLIIDSSSKHISHIKKQNYYWKFKLKVQESFITIENINNTLEKNKINGEIGILSIDIDGNDYWIWKAINQVDPQIIVIEYNARFGKTNSVSIPYEEKFNRSNNKKSKNIIYGASLEALHKLGKSKGYSLIGTNLNGNNAYFIKNNLLPKNNNIIKDCTAIECFKINSFKESFDEKGNIVDLSDHDIRKIIDKSNIVKI